MFTIIFLGIQDDNALRPLQGNPHGNDDNGARRKGWLSIKLLLSEQGYILYIYIISNNPLPLSPLRILDYNPEESVLMQFSPSSCMVQRS